MGKGGCHVTGALGSHYQKDAWRESWRAYLGLVSLLDDCVGKLLAELKRQNIYNDCLILFTSDHGGLQMHPEIYIRLKTAYFPCGHCRLFSVSYCLQRAKPC